MSRETRTKLEDHERRIAQLEEALLETVRLAKAAQVEKPAKKPKERVWLDIRAEEILKRRTP